MAGPAPSSIGAAPSAPPRPPPGPNTLLTIQQVADLLQVNVRTFQRMRKDGRADLPVVNPTNRTIRFRYRDVLIWLKSRTRTPDPNGSDPPERSGRPPLYPRPEPAPVPPTAEP